MYADNTDRMAATRRRGRPTLGEIAARPAEEPVVEVVVDSAKAMECPRCRRHMTPRIDHTKQCIRYASMPCCGVRVRITYARDGKPETIQSLT